MRNLRPTILFIVAIAASAMVLVACGSDSGDSSADEKAITDAIVSSGTTDTPSECTELETQRFLEQVQSEKGAAAIAACKEPDDNSADAIDVSGVQVDGDKATADSTITGGAFDGQTLRISLVKEEGKWKLDHLDAFKAFDKAKLVAAFSANFAQGSGSVTPQQGQCITAELDKLDDQKLQEIILSGDRNQLVPVVAPCVSQ